MNRTSSAGFVITSPKYYDNDHDDGDGGVVWGKAESLLVFIRQVAAAICNCMFWLRGSTPKSPLPLWVRDPI